MRTYEVYITKYLKGTKKNAIGLKEQKTAKTVHKIVKAQSKESVKNRMKREHPNSMIHVYVKY